MQLGIDSSYKLIDSVQNEFDAQCDHWSVYSRDGTRRPLCTATCRNAIETDGDMQRLHNGVCDRLTTFGGRIALRHTHVLLLLLLAVIELRASVDGIRIATRTIK